MKKTLIYILIPIILIAIITSISYIYIKSKVNKLNYIDVPIHKLRLNEGVGYNISKYQNILLIGLDSEDNYNTDAIIMSINTQTKEISLVGVNIYTFLKIEDESFEKIDRDYLYKNAFLIMNTLNKNLDLNINKLIAFDLTSIKNIVDMLGGLKLELSSQELEYIEEFQEVSENSLTGEQVISYINTKNDNSVRTERIIKVIENLFDSEKSIDLIKINQLVNDVFPKVYTNIEGYDFITFIFNIINYDVVKHIQLPASTKTIFLNGESYEFSIDISTDVVVLYKELFNIENYEPSDTVKEIYKMFE